MTPVPVALLGFSRFERNALASYLTLTPAREPSYVHVLDVDQARFVVADADQPGVHELLETLGRVGDSVFIGAQAPARAAAWLMRPVDAAQVLRELDNLLSTRSTGPLPLTAGLAMRARAAAPPTDLARPARRAHDEPAGAAGAEQRQADAQLRRQRREAALRPVTVRRALLVDDSEVALAFLERHLHRHDIEVDWAMDSGQALALLAQRAYGIVLLDLDLGDASELDGLALCQQIKRATPPAGGRAPLVVIVSASNDAVDRVRATLAGADGHVGKPLDGAALDRLLDSHGLGHGRPPRPPRPR